MRYAVLMMMSMLIIDGLVCRTEDVEEETAVTAQRHHTGSQAFLASCSFLSVAWDLPRWEGVEGRG